MSLKPRLWLKLWKKTLGFICMEFLSRSFTDCAASKQTMNNYQLKPRIARWILSMTMFEYKVERGFSKLVRSKKDSILVIYDPMTEMLQRAQERDVGLQAIRALLQEEPYQNYFLLNGVLFQEDGANRKLAVPRAMQNEIIQSS